MKLGASETCDNEKSDKSFDAGELENEEEDIFEIKMELEDDTTTVVSIENEDEMDGKSQISESKSISAISSQIHSESPTSEPESDLVDRKKKLGCTRVTLPPSVGQKKKLLFHLPEAQNLQEAMSNPHVPPRVSYGYMITMALQVLIMNSIKSRIREIKFRVFGHFAR